MNNYTIRLYQDDQYAVYEWGVVTGEYIFKGTLVEVNAEIISIINQTLK